MVGLSLPLCSRVPSVVLDGLRNLVEWPRVLVPLLSCDGVGLSPFLRVLSQPYRSLCWPLLVPVAMCSFWSLSACVRLCPTWKSRHGPSPVYLFGVCPPVSSLEVSLLGLACPCHGMFLLESVPLRPPWQSLRWTLLVPVTMYSL